MSKTTHTHRGHCQACGRVQAVSVDRGDIAKHGYTSQPHGYFAGTCAGSDHKPLELERTLTDLHIKHCNETAHHHEVVAVCYKAGDDHPPVVCKYRDGGMHSDGKPMSDGYAQVEYSQKGFGTKPEPLTVFWKDASPYERARGVTVGIAKAEQAARYFRGHAKMLTDLAIQVHGQKLRPVDPPNRLEVGDKVTLLAWGLKDAKVEALRTFKTFTGESQRQARFTRGKDGKSLWIPLRSIRGFIKGGATTGQPTV